MKLRFEVDQAACFRRGKDCPKSIVTIEVDPAKIPEQDRNLIADRLVGIDVYRLKRKGRSEGGMSRDLELMSAGRIMAEAPDYDALIAAVRADQKNIEDEQAQGHSKAETRTIAVSLQPAKAETETKAKSFAERMAEKQNASDAAALARRAKTK